MLCFQILFWFRMGISYVCITHQEESGFSVHQEKGWPCNDMRKCFEVSSNMTKDIQNFRNKIKYENGTNIVLILSIASNAMIRVVSMFPEVFYMDFTCTTKLTE